ncbi:MAG: HDOD domain-containing protein [Sterolibacterium sp.]|jgi:HD-like signal output (HDOD) protein|nr:HDOD domain-containing protein [Sterolibacterium sp.]
MIKLPLPDTDAWVLTLSKLEMPVLRRTAQELASLREHAEEVNARTLAAVILQDPLMTLRVFAYLAEHRRKTQLTDVTTIERALMMIGVGPFFRDFDSPLLIENHLKDAPKALLGLLRVITRSRRAAHWAHDWAVHRHDLDADEITLAALLHDVAEMLIWCFAPTLALEVEAIKAHDPQLRSASAQVQVLGITLLELQQAFVHFWGLPHILTKLMDHSTHENPRVQNVALAVDLARHSSQGWNDAALPDDLKGIQALLHIGADMLPMKLGVDAECLSALLPPEPPAAA